MFALVLSIALFVPPAPTVVCCQPPPCGQLEELTCDQLRSLESWLEKELLRLTAEIKSLRREIVNVMKIIKQDPNNDALRDQLNALRLRLGVLRQQLLEFIEILEFVQALIALNCTDDN